MADQYGAYKDATRAGSASNEVCARESALGSIHAKLARLSEAIGCSEKCTDEVHDSLMGPRPANVEKDSSKIHNGAFDEINIRLEDFIARVQHSTSTLERVREELRG